MQYLVLMEEVKYIQENSKNFIKMKKLIAFSLVLVLTLLTTGCAHKSIVSSVRATNIYSDSDTKIPGNFIYVVDQTSLSKFRKTDAVQGLQCGAHKFPIDGTDAFVNSLPSMLEEVFVEAKQSNGEARENTTQLIIRIERFDAKLRFNEKFFGMDADATVELGVSVTANQSGKRLFGTNADTQRSKIGDGGSMCAGGAEVLAEATRDAIKDVLEKIGERMANSQSLRKASQSSADRSN